MIGAAGLESFLLVLCILRKEDVTGSSRWRTFHKNKSKPFLQMLGHMDLGTLIEIAGELEWFPRAGIPETFTAVMSRSFGPEIVDRMVKILPPVLNVTQVAAGITKQARNWLHPARCIREMVELSDGLAVGTCLFLMLGISGLSEYTVTQRPARENAAFFGATELSENL